MYVEFAVMIDDCRCNSFSPFETCVVVSIDTEHSKSTNKNSRKNKKTWLKIINTCKMYKKKKVIKLNLLYLSLTHWLIPISAATEIATHDPQHSWFNIAARQCGNSSNVLYRVLMAASVALKLLTRGLAVRKHSASRSVEVEQCVHSLATHTLPNRAPPILSHWSSGLQSDCCMHCAPHE
jgi:hypothetical protein